MSASADHWAVLGLTPGASAVDVHTARRRLAKSAHPDAGGTASAMQAVNAAAEAALAELARAAPRPSWAPPTAQQRYRGPRRRPRPQPSWPAAGVDHPSFVIEALPAEAFKWVLVAAAELGDVIDDDPPYRLEVALRGDLRGWCELTLGPDAGATTASLAVAGEPGYPPPGIERVRDAWVAALNSV